MIAWWWIPLALTAAAGWFAWRSMTGSLSIGEGLVNGILASGCLVGAVVSLITGLLA